MVDYCQNDDCDKATENGNDLCPLCNFRQKDGDPEFNALTDRINN